MSGKLSHTIELSAVLTVVGIIILFSASIAVVLIAPSYVDPAWTAPSSDYQVQMHEVADPHFYISGSKAGRLQAVQRLIANYSLSAFQESETVRIIAPDSLKRYITRFGDQPLKLTSRLLLLRRPITTEFFDGVAAAEGKSKEAVAEWAARNPDKGAIRPRVEVLELFVPNGAEAFAVASADEILGNWVDAGYELLERPNVLYHKETGVLYALNPIEYRIIETAEGWKYDPHGEPIASLDALQSHPLGFVSRRELIEKGEHFFAIEGCWYCHTDQTRTLVQDCVLNGSAEYPAPPSSPNEYIYDRITFPGTRRIGPDLSRVGIKRPSRDWHMSHFWSPKTASRGSIMPRFQHFFDFDPRGTRKSEIGVPNHRFEAVYQYLMTKGTRITPPTEAWWLGKDPVQTKLIIEGRKP